MSLQAALFWVALISFFLAIFPIPAKINLVALGLFCLTLLQGSLTGIIRL